MPLDVEDRRRIPEAILHGTLDTDLVIVSLVRLQRLQCVRELIVATELARRQRIYAAATKPLGPRGINEVGSVELIGRVDLKQGPAPGLAAGLVGYVLRPIEEQTSLLRSAQSLLEDTRPAGHAPRGRDVSCELAEGRQILEADLEVADVSLVFDDRDAADVGRRSRRIGRLADTAIGGRYIVTNALAIDRRAGVVVIEVAGIEVVLLYVGPLIIEEQSGHPLESATPLGGQAQLLRQRSIVESFTTHDQPARTLAEKALE